MSVLCSIVVYCFVFSLTMLNMLCFILSMSTRLCYASLYYTMLYYTVLF